MNKVLSYMFAVCFFLPFAQKAEAKLSIKNTSELSDLCYKRNRNLKNYADVCTCQKKNFRWLFANKQWKDVKRVYLGKVSRKELRERDGLSAVDFLIVTVENKCFQNRSYLAPKAKALMKKAAE